MYCSFCTSLRTRVPGASPSLTVHMRPSAFRLCSSAAAESSRWAAGLRAAQRIAHIAEAERAKERQAEQRSVLIADAKRAELEAVSGTPKFKDLVCQELEEALRWQMNIFKPNAMQAQALHRALSGEDLNICAQTGSGKTLMFLLPMLQRLHTTRPPRPMRSSGKDAASMRFLAQPEALVVVPSRELACQVAHVAQQLASALPDPPVIGLVTNGEKFKTQKMAMRNSDLRLVIATPARLLYHLSEGNLTLERLLMVAIDEADAVLYAADGINREATELLKALPKKTRLQTLLTGATMAPAHAEAIAARFPRIAHLSHPGVLVPTLQRSFHFVRGDKSQELLRLLERSARDPWLAEGAQIIFCSGARRAQGVHDLLRECMPTLRMGLVHGETPAADRSSALQAFADDDVRTLVCSDVLNRGLDFMSVRHVINYDLPKDVTTFIHRAGRTARRGQPGLVSSLVKPYEMQLYRQLTAGDHAGTPLERSSGRAGNAPTKAARPNTLEGAFEHPTAGHRAPDETGRKIRRQC